VGLHRFLRARPGPRPVLLCFAFRLPRTTQRLAAPRPGPCPASRIQPAPHHAEPRPAAAQPAPRAAHSARPRPTQARAPRRALRRLSTTSLPAAARAPRRSQFSRPAPLAAHSAGPRPAQACAPRRTLRRPRTTPHLCRLAPRAPGTLLAPHHAPPLPIPAPRHGPGPRPAPRTAPAGAPPRAPSSASGPDPDPPHGPPTANPEQSGPGAAARRPEIKVQFPSQSSATICDTSAGRTRHVLFKSLTDCRLRVNRPY
jgi:translation initiation factor IF-2